MNRKFSEQSDLYARYRPDYPKEMYDVIFRHLSSTQNAWDCATGSGQIAKHLAKHFKKVYATDISEAQLDHAPLMENIIYRQALAEESGLPADNFELITVGQAIHWFDLESFYQEVRRVAQSEALLAVIGYGMVRIDPELDPIIEDLYEKSFDTYYKEARKYLDKHYKNLPFPFKEIPTPSLENSLQWSLEDLEGYFNSWSAIQKIKAEQNYNPSTSTIERLRDRISDPKEFEVSFPIFMRLGIIDK